MEDMVRTIAFIVFCISPSHMSTHVPRRGPEEEHSRKMTEDPGPWAATTGNRSMRQKRELRASSQVVAIVEKAVGPGLTPLELLKGSCMAWFLVLFLLTSTLQSEFWLPNRGGHGGRPLLMVCGQGPVGHVCEAGCFLAELRYGLLISPTFYRLSSSSLALVSVSKLYGFTFIQYTDINPCIALPPHQLWTPPFPHPHPDLPWAIMRQH